MYEQLPVQPSNMHANIICLEMSSQTTYAAEEPGDEPDDVLFNTIYGVRSVELNRPKKLNSLNGSMARKIIPRLQVCIPQFQAVRPALHPSLARPLH